MASSASDRCWRGDGAGLRDAVPGSLRAAAVLARSGARRCVRRPRSTRFTSRSTRPSAVLALLFARAWAGREAAQPCSRERPLHAADAADGGYSRRARSLDRVLRGHGVLSVLLFGSRPSRLANRNLATPLAMALLFVASTSALSAASEFERARRRGCLLAPTPRRRPPVYRATTWSRRRPSLSLATSCGLRLADARCACAPVPLRRERCRRRLRHRGDAQPVGDATVAVGSRRVVRGQASCSRRKHVHTWSGCWRRSDVYFVLAPARAIGRPGLPVVRHADAPGPAPETAAAPCAGDRIAAHVLT